MAEAWQPIILYYTTSGVLHVSYQKSAPLSFCCCLLITTTTSPSISTNILLPPRVLPPPFSPSIVVRQGHCTSLPSSPTRSVLTPPHLPARQTHYHRNTAAQCRLKHHSMCEFAAAFGYLEVLKWARANGCPWDKARWHRWHGRAVCGCPGVDRGLGVSETGSEARRC